MGLFPFASTVGSMSNFSEEPVNARLARNPREAWHSAWCWRPNESNGSHRTTGTPLSFSHTSHTHISASSFDTARGRDDRSTGERSPP